MAGAAFVEPAFAEESQAIVGGVSTAEGSYCPAHRRLAYVQPRARVGSFAMGVPKR